MNTFGRLFRISILGESHGECIGVLIDGCPAGLSLCADDLLHDLEKRKPHEKGTTSRKEDDIPKIKCGVFNERTTGAPILILFENKNIDSSLYEKMKNFPRPGHADFVAFRKFGGFNDYRGGGHFSGRLTVALVAAGVLAKKLLQLANTNTKINANILEIGGKEKIADQENNIMEVINEAIENNDSVGGIVECRVSGLPVGFGEPFFDSTESLLSHIIFSIPGIKGIEFGAGFKCAKMHGSECNDEILSLDGKTKTNNSGGVNGGITNGNELVFRVAVKPTSSIAKTQKTIDFKNRKQVEIKVDGRHDACIALRVPVVLEAVVAIVLADLMLTEQKIRNLGEIK